MGSNTIRFHIIIRVLAIALTIFLLFHLGYNKAFALTIILVFTLAVVQVISLIKFMERTNEDINNFFEAIQNNDFLSPSRAIGKQWGI